MMYGQPSYSEGRPEYLKPKTKELDSCGQCTRYLLIAINIVFFMCCCTVVGVTTWILIEKNYMSAIYGNVLMTVSGYLIVIGAAIAFFTTMVGCFGAIARNKVMLLIYFCALCLVAVLLIVGAILSIVYRTQIRDELQYTVMEKAIKKNYGVKLDNTYNEYITHAWDKAQRQINYKVVDHMRISLKQDYGVDDRITRDWDKCQTELKCCAVQDQGWSLYRDSEWYDEQTGIEGAERPYVPSSCCVRDQYGDYLDRDKCQFTEDGPPGERSGDITNEALYYRGCYNAGRDHIIEFSGYLIGMGMGVGIAMISGIVLSFVLLRLLD